MSKRIQQSFRLMRGMVLSVSVAALAGCGMFSSSDPRQEPSPLTEYAPGASVGVVWTASIGRGSGSSFAPTATGGAAYAATPNGSVAKVDLASGAIQWSASVSPDLSAGVGSDGITTAVAAVDGSVIAFDDTGKEKWRTRATSRVDVPPVVGDGVVVVRSSDYRIQAFDAETGETLWDVQRPGPALALKTNMRMIIIEGLVVSGLPNGRLIAIGAQDGSVQWEGAVAVSRGATDLERISDIVGEPQVQGAILCGVAYQGNITCFDISQGGMPIWEQRFSSTTGLGSDRVNVYAANPSSIVHAYGLETGEPAWQQQALRNRRVTAPAVVAPGVLVGDYQGYVHVLARSDGALLGRTQLGGGAIVSPPLATERGVLVQTGNGNLALIGVN